MFDRETVGDDALEQQGQEDLFVLLIISNALRVTSAAHLIATRIDQRDV